MPEPLEDQPLGQYMRVKYAHSSPSGKTHVYSIEDRRGGTLGAVQWYPSWRRYCFFPAGDYCIFSADCLTEITKLLERLDVKPGEASHA